MKRFNHYGIAWSDIAVPREKCYAKQPLLHNSLREGDGDSMLYALERDVQLPRLCNATQGKLVLSLYITAAFDGRCSCVRVFTFLKFERKSVSAWRSFQNRTLFEDSWVAIWTLKLGYKGYSCVRCFELGCFLTKFNDMCFGANLQIFFHHTENFTEDSSITECRACVLCGSFSSIFPWK
jgi:hypothetical protein